VYDSVKSIEQLNTPTPKFVPKYVTQETHELDGSTWMRYQAVRNKQYGLHLSTLREQGIVYAPSNDRLYMPVYDAFGKQLGHIAKAVATDKEPKVLTLKTEPAPWLHFPLHQTHSHRVILVEDIISSIKVAQTGFMVGALLGTHVSNDMILLLKAMGIREVIFMLDPDATGKAAKFVSNYSPYFSSVRLIPLTKGDPKEYTIEELHEAIN
jgi:DNA primase